MSLTVPADLFGRSVQVFFVPVQEQESDETTDIPMDELSRSLAALPDQYAAGNWNGYDEKPLNRDSHCHAKAFAENLPKAFRNADVGIDADGEVTFEWYRAKDCQCSLTFAESGNVYGSSKNLVERSRLPFGRYTKARCIAESRGLLRPLRGSASPRATRRLRRGRITRLN